MLPYMTTSSRVLFPARQPHTTPAAASTMATKPGKSTSCHRGMNRSIHACAYADDARYELQLAEKEPASSTVRPKPVVRRIITYTAASGAVSVIETTAATPTDVQYRDGRPQASHAGRHEHGKADEQHREHRVVRAKVGLRRHRSAECRATSRGRAFRQPMKRQQAEGKARRHEELNVRQVGEHVRAEREADGGHDRCASIAGEVSRQVVHAGRTQHEREEHHPAVRGVRVVRRPVNR